MILQAFLPLLLIALSTPALAQQYRWVDKDGRVQYTDTPPPASAKDIRKAAPASEKAAPAAVPYELARAQKDFPVTLYSAPNCKEGCTAVRDALNKRGVSFKEIQVWDAASNEELKRVSGGTGVPVTLVGRSMHRGFEQEQFDALLDSAGYPKTGVLTPKSQKAPPPPEGYAAADPGGSAKPAAPKPAAKAVEAPAPGGRYDPSSLDGPPPRTGRYALPGESK